MIFVEANDALLRIDIIIFLTKLVMKILSVSVSNSRVILLPAVMQTVLYGFWCHFGPELPPSISFNCHSFLFLSCLLSIVSIFFSFVSFHAERVFFLPLTPFVWYNTCALLLVCVVCTLLAEGVGWHVGEHQEDGTKVKASGTWDGLRGRGESIVEHDVVRDPCRCRENKKDKTWVNGTENTMVGGGGGEHEKGIKLVSRGKKVKTVIEF